MNSALPTIMYDQSQFTPLYAMDKHGLYLSEKAYLEMQRISGYAPDKWYTYTQNQPESFWFGAYDKDALEKESKTGFKNFTDPSFVRDFEQCAEESYRRTKALKSWYFEKFFKKERRVVDEMPQEIIRFLLAIQTTVEYIMARYLMTQPQRFYQFETKIKPFLSDKDIEHISTNGRYVTYISKARNVILDIAQKVANSGKTYDEYVSTTPDIKKSIENLSNDVGFLNWGWLGGELLDIKNIKKEIVELASDSSKLQEETKKMRTLLDAIHARNRIVTEGYSKKGIQIADIMGHAPILRFNLQTCVLALLKYADNLIIAARNKFNLTQDETHSYFFKDLIHLISTGQKVDSEEIDKRQKGFLQVYSKDGVVSYLAEEAHEQIAELLVHRKQEIECATELKGIVASWPDKQITAIRGKCFVMTTAFDAEINIKSFAEGQILVVTQTHPNIVPIMRQAKAIVTDEGGITCHAAIVSRELGKPCIIGTRLATKIFKNGDHIEVDILHGTVRKA